MRNFKKSYFLLALTSGILAILATGCTKTEVPVVSIPAPIVKTTEVSNSGIEFEKQIAGGTLGWPGLAVIGGGSSNKLFVVDAKFHNVVTALTTEGKFNERTDKTKYPNLRDAHAMVFTKDFKRMFTVVGYDYDVSWLIEYNPITLKEVGRVKAGKGSHHSALSPDDKYVYVANQYGGNISIINTSTMTKIKDIEVGEGPDYISPSMYWDGKAIDSPYLFITVDKAKKVAVLDWKKNEIVKFIEVPGPMHGVNLTPDGKHAWLAGIGYKEVNVIDVATLDIVKKIPFEDGPIHISISPDSKFAYVTTYKDHIFKIDTTTYEKIWESKGTVIPAHTGLSPDGKELWTLNHGMDTTRYPYLLGGEPVQGVQVFDTENGKLINEIPMEAMPHEIQFVPYSAFGVPTPKQDVSLGHDMKDMKGAVNIIYKGTTFLPPPITVKSGAKVKFAIDNQDPEDHVFGSKAANIKTVYTPKNSVTMVEWTADVKPGTYQIECEIHPGMDAKMVVN